MNVVYLMNQIHYENIKLLLVTSKGIMTSQVTNCNAFCTVVCALAMVASLDIKALKKATRRAGSMLFKESTILMQTR